MPRGPSLRLRSTALPRGSADHGGVVVPEELDLAAVPRVVLEDVVHGPPNAQDPPAPVGALPGDLLVHVRVRNLGPSLPDVGASPRQQILVEGERLPLE